MARERKGSIIERDGKFYARVTYKDEHGKRKDIWQVAKNRTQAREINKKLVRELDDNGTRSLDRARMTFIELADYYSLNYVKPAIFVDGRKVSGLRSVESQRIQVKTLVAHFGKRRIRDITHGDLERFKNIRLATPTNREKDENGNDVGQRSIASVNRELACLRRMFNIALRESWLTRSSFTTGNSLVSQADERKRQRIITRTEETRLLEACDEPRRRHLKPILVCLLDTGMRLGEALKLEWLSVNFDADVIHIKESHTKTLTARIAPMPERLRNELKHLWQERESDDANDLVFGIKNNIKRSWTSIRKDCGLSDVRLHDLRHSAASRLVSGNLPLQEVGRILGHSDASTTYRYVNANLETVGRARAIFDALNEQSHVSNELIN